MLRGSPNPKPGAMEPFFVLPIKPNDADVRVVVGLAQLAQFRALNISARNCREKCSVRWNVLKSDGSMEKKPGP